MDPQKPNPYLPSNIPSSQYYRGTNEFSIDMMKSFYHNNPPPGMEGLRNDQQNLQSGLAPKHQHLSEISANVAVQRADGDSSYIAATSWEELNFSGELLKGIYLKGFNKPSKIQAAALPLIIGESANLIAQAKNGSGKTAAFTLCMLSKVDPNDPDPQALCLAPTRELTQQIAKVIEELGQFTSISLYLCIPQAPFYGMNRSNQIIVGTPGKTLDLIKRRTIPTDNIKVFVLDEADEMIDQRNNMAPQVQQIRYKCPQNVQFLFFSATFPENVKLFADQIVPNAHKITVQTEELSVSSVSQFYMLCNDITHKFQVLADLYASMAVGQSVIFVKSRRDAFALAQNMKTAGHAVSLICGSQSAGPERIDITERDSIMAEFRSGVTRVLICTDVLSRGIDVPQVTLVVNYDLPLERTGRAANENVGVNMETYLHRIGRTGRFGLKGIAINLILPHEIILINEINFFYKFEIKELKNDLEEIESMVTKLRT